MEPRISILTLTVDDLQKTYDFYHHGLGLPGTSWGPDKGIVFLQLKGIVLAFYPKTEAQKEVAHAHITHKKPLMNFTLAHNVRRKDQVDALLEQAKNAGATIEHPAVQKDWGGYSGYFSDPDGYLWEIAYADHDVFDDHGHLIIA